VVFLVANGEVDVDKIGKPAAAGVSRADLGPQGDLSRQPYSVLRWDGEMPID